MSAPLDPPANPTQTSSSDEKTNCHHHESPTDGIDLRQAIYAIAGSSTPIYFGPERKNVLIEAIAVEREKLAKIAVATPPSGSPDFTGGEHQVWLLGNPARTVFKQTLSGRYGHTLDEAVLLDDRTFQNRRMLILRPALPSEYLLRWCVLRDVFQLPTALHGQVVTSRDEPNLAVSQPYIPQEETDQPLAEDIEAFMTAYRFSKVDPTVIAVPEIKGVTWYREEDGVLISDAFPRNFRKDSDTLALMPIDLIVALVPKGVSKLLKEPRFPWQDKGEPSNPQQVA
jgi:hypothetical protein